MPKELRREETNQHMTGWFSEDNPSAALTPQKGHRV